MRTAVMTIMLLWASPVWAEDPAQIIEHFYARLLEAMKSGMDFQGRFDALAPVVDQTFDLAGMTRLAVGPRLPPEDFDHVVAAFRRYTITNYARQFGSWEGERFETGTPAPAHGGGQLVPSRIIPATGESARLTYLMKQQDGGWRVADVLLDGTISQLAVRRSEFQSVLKQSGAEGLVQVLDQRSTTMAE
ncbi:MAG: ABC transporter substrate-binding protein [Rhodospirillaceae bacterium]|nr:ABC transporter substrate-binding protein [Rhodospirillales bacterium]